MTKDEAQAAIIDGMNRRLDYEEKLDRPDRVERMKQIISSVIASLLRSADAGQVERSYRTLLEELEQRPP